MQALHDFQTHSLDEMQRRLNSIGPERLKTRTRKAAVLIPLMLNAQNEPAFLFTKRSEEVGSHKGQVSFPGGMQDPEDLENDQSTALRETFEEIGIAPQNVRVLGTFHEMPAINSIRVTAIAGFLGRVDEASLVVQASEISEVFSLSLKQLLDPKLRFLYEYERNGKRGQFPVFTAGPHPVWGLTAIILRRFMIEVMKVELLPALGTKSDSFLGSER